jgi:hypothetical protein
MRCCELMLLADKATRNGLSTRFAGRHAEALENRIFNTIGPLRSGIFKALGEGGHADAAIGAVESIGDPGTRVEALLSIAEGLAGLPDPTQYSEWP